MERLPEFIGNHSVISLGLVGVTIALIYNEVSQFTRGYRLVGPSQLTDLVNRENALLIDLSPQQDFEKGHIAGSRHVAMSQFDPESPSLAKVRGQLPIVLVCRSGTTAGMAAKRLVKAGFQRVYCLDGGIGAWRQAELPLSEGRA